MNYDLFISYSRTDNQQGQIAAVVAEIERDFNRVAGRPMRAFFDTQAIKGMHDWRDRILEGLRESGLLLVCLSPNYLKSEYCEWELTEFLKHEASRGLLPPVDANFLTPRVYSSFFLSNKRKYEYSRNRHCA